MFNLVLNLKHTKIKKSVFACVYDGGRGEGGGVRKVVLEIHLEAKGTPAWKSLGTTLL